MTPLIRYDRWMKRVFEQQLGFWGEHWADVGDTKQFAAWRRLAEERGASADLKYHMTRSLLPEVLYAAGGVERELEHLRAALAEVQQFADEAAALHPHPSPAEWPAFGYHVSTPAMRDVWYSFANLLSWARSVVERTSRPYKPRSTEQAGLLPALAPGQLRDQVQGALDELQVALDDSRRFANYALHAGVIPGGGTPRADILPDHRLLARLPDPVTRPILTWEEFTFSEDRDMLTYATEVMESIEIFVDEVLDAFAADRPERVGLLPPWPA